jgi:hypothetical protein
MYIQHCLMYCYVYINNSIDDSELLGESLRSGFEYRYTNKLGI